MVWGNFIPIILRLPLGIFAVGGALAGILMTIGFGVQGIAAGSYAAIFQGSVGNVAAGSTFSIF